jgi:2-polyprenyl-6-methoxyphenol hydroxylase-like FAD-dependent oxidoreductase
MARILVIGAGICGLGTALLLARDGHDVTVVERDGSPVPDSPQAAWDGWKRRGIAQFWQPHNFMPGLRRILEAELPDLQEALRKSGAGRFDLIHPMPPMLLESGPRPIDAELWTYTARRPAGEWVFADAAHREPRVTMRRGVQAVELVTGAPAAPGVPHVTGVRTSEGEELSADLVIDAMGRISKGRAWLAGIGARPPYEEQADCGFAYYTRYFSGEPPERRGPILTPLGTISLLTLPGDNGTWSVTIFTASADRALNGLRDVEKWSKTLRACPLHAHWLDGEPLTEVLVMGGIVDRYRSLVVDGVPVATGFVGVADAWACTNPSAGRGLTVGFLHALRLRDVLRDGMDDPLELALRFHEVTEREVAPWYHAQVAVDRARFAQMDALREEREPPAPAGELARQATALLASMSGDPGLFRAALEYVATMTPLQEILRRPGVAERMGAVMEGMRRSPPPPMPGPTRQQLLELVS